MRLMISKHKFLFTSTFNSLAMKTILKNTVLVLVSFFFLNSVMAQVNLDRMAYSTPANKAEIEEMGLKFANAMISGDFETMKSLMGDNFVIYGVSKDSLDREGYIDLWKGYHAEASNHAIPEGGVFALEFTGNQQGMDGTWLMVYALATWTPNQTQKPVYSWVNMTMKVEKGKFTTAYNVQDNLAVVLQSGFQLVPPSTASNK